MPGTGFVAIEAQAAAGSKSWWGTGPISCNPDLLGILLTK